MEYPGAWCHVMNRGRRREKIFFSSQDYEFFIAVLKEPVEMVHLNERTKMKGSRFAIVSSCGCG